MIRRILGAALGLALVGAVTVWAMQARYSSGTAGISVTQANTNTAFVNNHSGGASEAFYATSVTVCSRAASANSCFFDMDGVATTADWRLSPGACVELVYSNKLGGEGWSAIGSICAAAETATFDIYAGR